VITSLGREWSSDQGQFSPIKILDPGRKCFYWPYTSDYPLSGPNNVHYRCTWKAGTVVYLANLLRPVGTFNIRNSSFHPYSPIHINGDQWRLDMCITWEMEAICRQWGEHQAYNILWLKRTSYLRNENKLKSYLPYSCSIWLLSLYTLVVHHLGN